MNFLRMKLEEQESEKSSRGNTLTSLQKKEIMEFQRRYLDEMKELQSTFEDFKVKAYAEFKNLKYQREEERAKCRNLQDMLENYRREYEFNESNIKETENHFKSRLDNIRTLVKTNEILKIELDNCKKEINYLQLQVNKLESSEKRLQHILLENDFLNDRIETLGFHMNSQNPLNNSKVIRNEFQPRSSIDFNNNNFNYKSQDMTSSPMVHRHNKSAIYNKKIKPKEFKTQGVFKHEEDDFCNKLEENAFNTYYDEFDYLKSKKTKELPYGKTTSSSNNKSVFDAFNSKEKGSFNSGDFDNMDEMINTSQVKQLRDLSPVIMNSRNTCTPNRYNKSSDMPLQYKEKTTNSRIYAKKKI